MKNLELIKTLTAAIYENATDGNKKENFKLTEALLNGIEAMTDSKFVQDICDCGYEPDFSYLVSNFKARCFVKDVALELVKAFEGAAVTIEADEYNTPYIAITYHDDEKGAVLWIDASNVWRFGADCELGTDYGPDVNISFELDTAKEIADKVKATLTVEREKYRDDVKAKA